jgi:adenylate cyclase
MTNSQRNKLTEKLKTFYDEASFEVIDADVVPEIENMASDEAARLPSVGYGFFDLRGFTKWSDEKRDTSVFKVLQPALNTLTRVVRSHKGTVEKPTGDGLMFIIGANERDAETVAVRTLQCAQDMADAMDSVVNPFMKSKRHIDEPFKWGVGVEMGRALIAKVGIRGHDFLTSISKAANYASKLENEAAGGSILVGERLYENAPESLQNRMSRYGYVHGKIAYKLEIERDEDGHPVALTKSMTAEQIDRFGLRDWVLGGPIPTGLFGGSKPEQVNKPHRWYGEREG